MTHTAVIEALCRIIEEALAVIEDEDKRREIQEAARAIIGEEDVNNG